MPVVFANPAGFWALLGVPAVLLIHFLQRQVRRETCTTLFLLDSLERDSVPGNRLHRLRDSPPLWFQLLCVLLLTWLLIEPRWHRAGAVQPVAIVIDSSASMQAFAREARQLLVEKAHLLRSSAARTEFFLFDSASPAPVLYHGEDPTALAGALDAWNPSHGLHDFTPALRIARNTAGRQGLVILLSDHRADSLPFDSLLLSVGSPLPNAGFSGVQVQETAQGPAWKVLVRNYWNMPLHRQLTLEAKGQTGSPQSLSLAPREIRSLSGSFPPGATEIILHLTPDAFPLDDVLPVLVPKPRSLALSYALSDRTRPLVDSLLPALAPAEPDASRTEPDLAIHGYDPLSPSFPGGPAILFVDRAPRQSQPQTGPSVAANHPLMQDLRWDALIVRPDLGIPFTRGDTALLWIGTKPFIWLRESASTTGSRVPQLVLNFDPVSSNASKLPAFVLLLHRYARLVRENKRTLEHRLAETGQAIPLPPAPDRSGPDEFSCQFMTWSGKERPLPTTFHRVTLPAEPGFASLQFRGQPLLRLASHFADTREADLSQAAPADQLTGRASSQVLRYTEASLITPIWLLLLTAALIASWAWRVTKDE